MKQYLLQLFFLLFAIQVVIAQQFPVQVIPQTIPPRPVVLSDYANASSVNDKVRVQLILNDLTELNREVRLKLFIEGQGINAQSNDVVVGATPIFLEGGVATTLGTAQLAPYFDLQNLQGISPGVYGNSLPEGSYSFCFEVYDLFTGNVVSAKTCTNFVLFDNDPPLLNLPLNAVGIQEMNPLNIVFQWTPRHINVSNVQYELIVSEIWDLNIDPQAAFLSSPPIFQTTTTQTTFIYDGLQPSLIPGKRYGWRVRAFAAAGAEEIGVFTNNGFSEIFYFDYQTQCDEPLFPDVEELTNRSAELTWQGNFDHLDYTVKYREKDAESEWYDLTTPQDYIEIDNLEPETTYEYKIQGNCMFGSYGETFIQEFTTLSDEASSYQGCAIEPEPILLENQERLTELFLYDNFTAGKFKVRVLEVENSTSPFKGKGYVTIPWLGFITIAAEFENIELNTDKELISGAVVTTYDPDWGNVLNTDGVFDDVFGNNGDVIQFDASDMVISDVQVSADGAITLIDNEGNSVPIVVGTPVVITDSTGNQWLVTNDGEVVELGPAAEGGVVTSENTNGVSSSGSVTAISSQDVVVTFTESGFYAFDPLPAGASSSLASEYNTISQASGGTYDVPYKAISDITGHTTDFLEGNVTFANGKTKSDLIFKTTEGTAIDTTWSGNTVSLSLTKQFEFGKTAILATVKPADSTGNYDVAGTADLWHMSPKTVNVTVVPINGSSTGTASQIQTELNTIYEKAGISFNVDLKDDFEVPANVWDIGPTTGSLDVGDSGVFSNYSPEENAIKNYYKDARDIEDDQYYMFVFNNVPIVNEDPSKNTQGFMPLKRQYGFVFNNSTTTMAHELGHGVFGLEHYTASGTDDFLMHEENITGTVLPHMDWQTIHAAGLQLYLFQGDSDGENYVSSGLFSKLNFGKNEDNTYTFLTPAAQYIVLPDSVKNVTKYYGYYGTSFLSSEEQFKEFMTVVPGTLKSFQVGNKTFQANIISSGEDFVLAGYFSGDERYIESNYGIEINEQNNNSTLIFAIEKNENNIGYKAIQLEVGENFTSSTTNSVLQNPTDFPYSSSWVIDRKDLNVSATGSQYSYSEAEIAYFFDQNYNENNTHNTLLIRNKLLEFKTAYPSFVSEYAGLQYNESQFENWSMCATFKSFEELGIPRTFEVDITNEFCQCVQYDNTNNSPTYPDYRHECSQNTNSPYSTSEPTRREWLELFYRYLKDRSFEITETISNDILDYNQVNPDLVSSEETLDIIRTINLASQNDIASMSSLAILRILSKIANEPYVSENNDLNRDMEAAAIKLIQYSSELIAKDIILGMESPNIYNSSVYLYEQLFRSIDDDYLFGLTNNNREKFISECTKLIYKDSQFFDTRLTSSIEDMENRLFIFEYSNFVKSLGIFIVQTAEATSVFDEISGVSINNEILHYDIDKEFLDTGKISLSQTLDSGWFTQQTSFTNDDLLPFDLVTFVNRSNLSLVKSYTENLKDSSLPVPAIAIAYASQAASNETTSQAIYTTLDVIGLIGSGGTLAGVSGLSKLQKIYLIADIGSSGLSITSTALSDNEANAEVRSILNTISGITGVVSLGDNISGFKNLVAQSKNKINSGADVVQLVDDIESLPTKIANMDDVDITKLVTNYPDVTENYIKLTLKNISDKLIAGENNIDLMKNQLVRVLQSRKAVNNGFIQLITTTYPNILNKYNNLLSTDVEQAAKFLNDFSNADTSVLVQLNKTGNESILFEAWLNFTNKYPNRIFSCN
ncbi:fibronectin type III domain-containing protein [Dokdonia sp. PRO95]|uniref:fibronectin type III domain-containing protein n=1 Tax=Dokdonia sp. PRO95 TaxID=1239415 RepID=UPI000550A76B|nr:fibronectin type III domain-containing protein [Dokdonia sp. PRO95]